MWGNSSDSSLMQSQIYVGQTIMNSNSQSSIQAGMNGSSGIVEGKGKLIRFPVPAQSKPVKAA
jgi:hypothetical protein